MRIIIAEDDNVTRLILEAELFRLGHKVLTARDGEGAWALYKSSGADVIISDGMMPGVDGFELCRLVRTEPSARYSYFIFLTNLVDETFVRRGMEAGADDYLAKPLDRAALMTRLAVAARISQLYRRLAAQQAELEALNRALFSQARTDALTGLANRLRLTEDLTDFIKRIEGGERFCAIMCDIDHFKLYNDHYGHAGGDSVLRKVAETLRASLRDGDRAYRFGGEEFLIIAPVQKQIEAVNIAERYRMAVERLAEPHLGSPFGVVTLSVGSTISQTLSGFSATSWLGAADAGLYRSKELGRNRNTFCSAA